VRRKWSLPPRIIVFVQVIFQSRNCIMPRRNTSNNEAKEPPRSLRRSSRLQTNESDDAVSRSSNTQATPTASSVAPFANSPLQQAAASSDNTAVETSSLQLPPLETKSSLTLRTRKRDSSSDDQPSRKKGRSSSTARVSLDVHANDDDSSSRESGEASHPTNVNDTSTITPVCSVQTRARTDDKEEDVTMGPSKASLDLGNNNDLESRSSTSSSVSARQQQRQTLPAGVVDLYSLDISKVATCKQNYCEQKSLTDSFLSSYGYEYYQHLKDKEHDSSSSQTSSTNRTNSTDNESLSLSSPLSGNVVSLANTNRPVLGSTPLVGDLETLDRQPHLTEKMRAILMDWLVELSEEYKFAPQTLQLAVSLVDKCLARGAPTLAQKADEFFTVKREMLQCVGWYVVVKVNTYNVLYVFVCLLSHHPSLLDSACMWIASKIEEVEPPCAMDFVYISDNSYTKEQIADMELTVCTALEFRLSQVTPYHFVSEFLRASCACGDPSCCAAENSLMKYMVLYLLEMSLLPSELAYTNASLKAAAAVYVARVTLGVRSGGTGYWTETLEHYTGYDLGDLEETAMTIHRYHRAAEESQLKSCFVKFTKEKYKSVALKTVPLESDLGF